MRNMGEKGNVKGGDVMRNNGKRVKNVRQRDWWEEDSFQNRRQDVKGEKDMEEKR